MGERIYPTVTAAIGVRLAAYRGVIVLWPGPTITSKDIGERVGVNASRVRHDLMRHAGGANGLKGQGYSCEMLSARLRTSVDNADDRAAIKLTGELVAYAEVGLRP